MVAQRRGSCLEVVHAHEDGGSGMLDSEACGGDARCTRSGDGEHEEENVKGELSLM
jgi:hypothetical protein